MVVVVVLVVVLVVVSATRVGRTSAIVVVLVVVLVVVAGGFDMAVTALVGLWPLIGATFPAVVPSKQDAVHAKMVRRVPTAIRETMRLSPRWRSIENSYAGTSLRHALQFSPVPQEPPRAYTENRRMPTSEKIYANI